MQSMIASQQQLIRRSLNSSQNNSESNGDKNLNSSDSMTTSEKTCKDKDKDKDIDRDKDMTNSMSSSVESMPDNKRLEMTSTDWQINSSGSDVKKNVSDKSEAKSGLKKKRSNNSWLNILNPSYKTRHEEFKRLFSDLVPNNERLVVDYSCALQKEILVHGRLYLSLNYISFYANIFKWETSLVIKCRDITALTKTNTARVIPNAIQVVTTTGDKYVFTSFAARDKTYVMLFRLWQNALLDQPMSSAQLWQWVHYSYGEDLGLTSDDDEEYYSDNLVHRLSAQPQVMAPENSDSCNSSDPELTIGPDVYEDCVESKSLVTNCRCSQHEGKLIMNATFALTIDRAFELIFTDSKFIHNLHKSRRTYDLCVSQWEDSATDKMRQLTYTVALNHTLIKTARTIECQRLIDESNAGKYYTIKSEVDNEGVPYCDTFSMHSLWCLTQDSEDLTRIKVHARVVYKKNVWGLGLMKSMIEKSSIQGITDFCADLSKQLPNWLQFEQNSGIGSPLADLKLNAKIIDYINTDSSVPAVSDAIIPDSSHTSDPIPDSKASKLCAILVNMLSVSDTFLMRIIFFTLLLSIFLNISILFRIWSIESNVYNSGALPLPPKAMAKNPVLLKEFIDNCIQMIKIIETNLLEVKHNLNYE